MSSIDIQTADDGMTLKRQSMSELWPCLRAHEWLRKVFKCIGDALACKFG